MQRLNPFVTEAQTFDQTLKIIAAQTLRRWSAKTGNNYGESWTSEECQIADIIAKAYKQKIISLPSITKLINDKTNEKINQSLVQQVINKIEKTDEVLLKQDPPYLNDEEYNTLKQHQKFTNKRLS